MATITKSRWLGLLAAAGATLFLALTFRPVVEGDGIGYFSYLHAVLVNHSLDMTEEFVAAQAANIPVRSDDLTIRSATGARVNQFSIGPALLSVPAYLAALVIRPSGRPEFGAPFTVAFTLASLFYGLAALALSYRLARTVIPSAPAAASGVGAALFGTPALFYLLYEPSYAHMFSAFMVTAFLYLWWTRRDHRSLTGYVLLGLLGGLMALTRWQDAAIMIVTLLDLPRAGWRWLLMAASALFAFAPQFLVDLAFFGSWLPSEASASSFDPLHGHYPEVLFSSFHGLLTWSPVVVLAILGWFFIRDRTLRLACFAVFVTQLAIVGAYQQWWGGMSFGMRYFINLLPFFALGLAALAARVGSRVYAPVLAAVTGWNLLLIANFVYVLRSPVDTGFGRLLAGQWTALPSVPRLFAQGAVIRSLLFESPFRRPGGALLLVLEGVIVMGALTLGQARIRGATIPR